MKLAFHFGLIVSSLCCALLSAQAQSANELRARYGSPLEAYEIRPHILMTVKSGDGGQICQYVVEARHTFQDKVTDESLMSDKTALELIDELVPVSLRGRSLGESIIISSCLGVVIKTYERVEIRKYVACSSNGEDGIDSIVIEWRKWECRKD